MSGHNDTEETERRHLHAYTPRHRIPNIQSYRQEKEQRRAKANEEETHIAEPSAQEQENESRPGQQERSDEHNDDQEDKIQGESGIEGLSKEDKAKAQEVTEDTSQALTGSQDAKESRKTMQKRKDERAQREVTDPVTHLPVVIHDMTANDFKDIPKNESPVGSDHRTITGVGGASKSTTSLQDEAYEQQGSHSNMEKLFPPPNFDVARAELIRLYQRAFTVGLGLIIVALTFLLVLERSFTVSEYVSRSMPHRRVSGILASTFVIVGIGLGLGFLIVIGVRQWVENKVREIWETELWEAERQQSKKFEGTKASESPQWLNALLASIWPLINPDLFTSLADILEDVMQASLPKLVRMVSVDDIGQGSESIRVLGIRWLPTGAAAQSVDTRGHLQQGAKNSDRAVPGEGEVEDTAKEDENNKDSQKEGEQESEDFAEGMEAEEGDFVNIEVAFAYRSRSSSKRFRDKVKNAHIYMALYLPGNIKLPIWAELRGVVGTARMRLQLTPDPPFVALATLTFLGQPKVDVSCMPLTRKGINILDLPVISNFVQSSIDAAVAEYVAPKSKTVNLKDMLVGDDIKSDTNARGIIVVRIIRGYDFKQGDSGLGPLKDGSADPYVSVGWAKFGKPVFSTRVIQSDMEPQWGETGYIMVTPEELNVDERLRVQLWDSDRTTADDDLGRIEIDLRKLMRDPATNGRMQNYANGFTALSKDEKMPGKLEWSVGYFPKVPILDSQIEQQKVDTSIRNVDQLKRKVDEQSERKLREAKHDESREISQQKAEDLKERADEMICNAPPPNEYPSGVFSIQIHQITGLEYEKINKYQASKDEEENDEAEQGDDLPSSYCTIIVNHQKLFKTRTKPKNSKPFFNAGTERFIRDWRTTDVLVAVRDSRVHEVDALLGVVSLPLNHLYAHSSQTSAIYPLAGGIGFGRIRISTIFRSVKAQLPRNLLGWDYGTLVINSNVTSADDLPHHFQNMHIKFRSSLTSGKMHATGEGTWKPHRSDSIHLAVRKRYASPLVLEFRSHAHISDKTRAFSVLWLQEIADDEELDMTIPVWKGDLERAENNYIEECGERLGSIKMKLKFAPGLSGYHVKYSSKDAALQDVMEVLDASGDHEQMEDKDVGSSSSSSESDDEGSKDKLGDDGKRGPIGELKDYKNHRHQLHRRNRGLMQWKGPRTLEWMVNRGERTFNRAQGLFEHKGRESGVETEV
ncbi:MAG: hypothetical protein M1820_006700 [Bogoriella megaspora]|nr:MAG: hypothetical protein M1820_006700 [Bogoriella megaspora]